MDLFNANMLAVDEGNAATITVDRSPFVVQFVTAGAETRTLARPTRSGLIALLAVRTYVGNLTLTVTGGLNTDGDTTFTLSAAGQWVMFMSCKVGSDFVWRKVADYQTGNVTPTEAGFLSGLTAGTGAVSKALVLDANGSLTVPAGTDGEVAFDGNKLTTEAGTGITTGTGTVYRSSVMKIGGIIFTRIIVDLTGLTVEATDGDIIGLANVDLDCHIGRITAARNGTIFGGRMTCLEVPTTGNTDVNLYAADEATGSEGDAISGLTETALVDAGGDWTLGEMQALSAVPAANQYLYLTNGAAANAGLYDAGKFLIELYGYDA